MFQFTCPSRSTTPALAAARDSLAVSIHVPLAEHDVSTGVSPPPELSFQFTCPSRSTTIAADEEFPLNQVSIHVPLAEHDQSVPFQIPEGVVSIHVPLAEHDVRKAAPVTYNGSFNSRAPRGARLLSQSALSFPFWFQFTCPSRSTTALVIASSAFLAVSIHVPLAEHDRID